MGHLLVVMIVLVAYFDSDPVSTVNVAWRGKRRGRNDTSVPPLPLQPQMVTGHSLRIQAELAPKIGTKVPRQQGDGCGILVI
jgi:hypothetical protein